MLNDCLFRAVDGTTVDFASFKKTWSFGQLRQCLRDQTNKPWKFVRAAASPLSVDETN